MKQNKHTNLWLEVLVIAASLFALMLLLYFVMIVSFQNGASSISVTMKMAERIAVGVFEEPTQEEIESVSLMIRYGAHLALFFIVGLVTAFVSMVICRKYFRIIGILVSGVICYGLAYYTEYYKQYIDGRHFHVSDVSLNWYGSLAGIICMVVSYFLNRLLVKLSS
ncbi:MAG: VanZ family protein [Lachnospiraceae bacterium]|nr:VanZ family protein [Lachnospiraceae bacterium]